MAHIVRVCLVSALVSAARGQRTPSRSPSTDGASEKIGAEDRLLSTDPLGDDEDFADPFEAVDSAMTVGLDGGKLRVFSRHSGKGLDRLFTLDFGRVQELDANGKAVKGRSVKISNAASTQDAELVAEQGVVGGAKALITRLSMPLAFSECNATSATGKGYSGKGKTGKGNTGKGSTGKGNRRLSLEDIDNDTDDWNDTDDANDSYAEYEDELEDEDMLEDEVDDWPEENSTEEDLLEDDNSSEGDDEVSAENVSDDDIHSDVPGNFAIEAFIFLEDAAVEYGDEIIEVSRGQLKFNLVSSAWPFCGSSHSLLVDMGIHLKRNNHKAKHFGEVDDDFDEELDEEPKSGKGKDNEEPKSGKGKDKEEPKSGKGKDKEDSTDDDDEPKSGKDKEDSTDGEDEPKSGKGKHGRHRKMLLADSGETEVFMDMPTLALVDGSLVNCSVELDTKGDKFGIEFTFPAFNDTLVYDPIAGTSVDLSARTASKNMADVQDERSDDLGLGDSEEDMITGRSAPGMGGCSGLQHLLAGLVVLATFVA